MHGQSEGRASGRSRRCGRATGGLLLLAFALASMAHAPALPRASAQTADQNAEARVFFEQGNRHFEAAMEASGARRLRLLEQALRSYVSSLRIVRSRNALFNAALTLDALDRPEEAFSYLGEYLTTPGLSEGERRDGESRRDGLRPKIATVVVTSDPPGATLRVDRLDLAPIGRTPLEIALAPGEHTLHLEATNHRATTATARAERGASAHVEVSLEPIPVALLVETQVPGKLTRNGEPIEAGAPLEVRPGTHVIRFEPNDGPVEERVVDVPLGSPPVTVAFRPAPPRKLTLVVRANVEAQVRIDDQWVGTGTEMRLALRPGPHRITIAAEGHHPEVRDVVLTEGSATRLDVHLRPRKVKRKLGKTPLYLGLATAGVGAVAVGLSLRAVLLRDRYEDGRRACLNDPTCTEARYQTLAADRREVERANGLADGFWIATAALGVGTLLTLLLNRRVEREPSRAIIHVGPTVGGLSVGAELRFGSP